LKILEYAYVVSAQEKILEIRRDESQLLRNAKAQKLEVISKPLAEIRYKGVVISGLKYIIAYSEWINPF